MQEYKPESDPQVRSRIIGATDGAAILGLSPWRSAVDVYLEKIGEGEHVDLSDNEAVQIGVALEDDVAELYEKRTGALLEKYPGTAMLKDHEFIGCHPDYVTAPEEGEPYLVECKTAGIASPMHKDKRLEWGLEGSDEVPQQYLVQAHHQMLCTGFDRCDIAALIGGRGLVIHTVKRDEQFLEWYEDQLEAFWHFNVMRGIPPVPETLNDVKLLYRKDDGGEIEADVQIKMEIAALNVIRRQVKALEDEATRHELEIKKYMADNAVLTIGGKIAATWKASEQARIDTKALKERHPEIAAQVTKVSTVRRFLPKGEK